jgi:hypothetical protein
MDTRDLYKLVRELSEENDSEINLYDSVDVELSEDFVIETGVIGFKEDGIILHLDEDAMEMLDLNGILLESEEAEEAIDESFVNEGAVDSFKSKVAASENAFEMIYDAISGNYGDEIREAMQEMYDDISIDRGLHPDDDFEKIIEIVVDQLEDGYYDYPDKVDEDGQLDELSIIKRLMGKEEPPRLARVTHKTPAELWKQHTEPKKATDKVSVDPITGKTLYQKVKDLAEAEYQGRKVTLNKPMAGDVKKSKVYVKNAKGNVVKVNFGDKDMKIKKSNPERRKSFRARHNCDNPGPKWKARYWSCKAW